MAMDVIEGVPRRSRGELFRNAFIAGMALQQLDHRLPALLTSFFTEKMSTEQVVGMISQATGWKPSSADIRDVLAELSVTLTQTPLQAQIETDQDALENARKKMKGFM